MQHTSSSDMLNHWVTLAQISGCIHTHCHLQDHWQITPDFYQNDRGIFHLLRRGECQITAENQTVYSLSAGSLLFFPKGIGHKIHSSPSQSSKGHQINTEKNNFFQVKTMPSSTTSNQTIELLCGYFDYTPNNLLINELPEVIQVSVNNGHLEQLCQLIYAEMNSGLAAQKTAIDSLSNYLFIMILRSYLDNNRHFSHLLSIKDENLIRLINAIIQSPHQSWTIESMASYCYLSRSVFAKRFHEHIGLTPNRFLTQIRLNIATVMLKTTTKNLLDIALSVGFQSESYFGKTFKAQIGITPSEYRNSLKSS